jgi:glycosyltransferase involved in cell wall biosynthesis
MKVALAHYSSDADISGVTTWFENLVIRLHGDGIKLAVLLHHFGDKPERASLLPPLRDAGVSVEVVPRARTLVADVQQILGFLNRVQPDLFLPQCLHAHFFAAAIAGLQGLPWVLTIHSDDPHYWAIANARPPTHYGGKSVTVSEHIARLVAEGGLDHDSAVIPCGVEVPSQTAKYRSNPFRVVYSGRLVETQKRLSLISATLIRSCEINPNICAIIIGDGPSRASCQKAIVDAGLANRITLTERLAPKQVKQELLDAQAILLMSDYEGLPVALLEAMAAGVVPVARNIPSGIPELVHHNRTGLLVDDDPEMAAQALSRLASEPTLWQTCSAAARHLVADCYNEDVCYQRWRELIDNLYTSSKVRYPLFIPDLSNLPAHDSLLGAGYPSPIAWHLRVTSRMNRGVADVGQLLRRRL